VLCNEVAHRETEIGNGLVGMDIRVIGELSREFPAQLKRVMIAREDEVTEPKTLNTLPPQGPISGREPQVVYGMSSASKLLSDAGCDLGMTAPITD